MTAKPAGAPKRATTTPPTAGPVTCTRSAAGYEGMARERQLLSAVTLDELTVLNGLLRKVMLSIED